MSPETARLIAKAKKALARTAHLVTPAIPTGATISRAPHMDGPGNLFMKLEGRRFAKDFVLSAQDLTRSQAGLRELIANLQRASVGRPASYVEGINEIIHLIRTAEG